MAGARIFRPAFFQDTVDAPPQTLLLGLDARNEKDTWSLTEDPIVLIVVFGAPTTIKSLYVDAGFMDKGKATGRYTEVAGVDAAALPDLLKAVFPATTQTYIYLTLHGSAMPSPWCPTP